MNTAIGIARRRSYTNIRLTDCYLIVNQINNRTQRNNNQVATDKYEAAVCATY